MEKFNMGNMHHIHWNKIVFFLLFLGLSLNAFGQGKHRGNYNYLDFQAKPYYFGITLGVNSNSFKINHSKRFILNDSISIAEGISGPGLNIQMVNNLKIGEYFDFRFLPGFSFVERRLHYIEPSSDQLVNTKRIESIFIEAPFLVRFKSAPYRDMRMFVVTGMKYTFDVQNNSRARQADTLIKISPHDFNMELGAGMQFFFPYFIFSPEIKFSQGIGNILIFNDQLKEASVLEKLTNQSISISFHFEG